MDLFKNTLFINLEQRPDRLEHALAEFKKMRINAERVNAVKTKMGAVGCTLSHIRCLELAKQRDYDYVFICEDDITFLQPFVLKKHLEIFASHGDLPWDVCIIGGNNVPPYEQVNDFFVRVYNCQTTTGYIVKKHYYETLIANFKESAKNLMRDPTNKQTYALDMYWKRLQQQDKWFMITPPTVTQYENYSDIEERNVNYDYLMLDMNKKWLFQQRRDPVTQN
jgi:GR25 family glycosyltransferase involved in LPS biosynthesis